MSTALNVIISGGGIGGLTAAIALHQAGHCPRIIERAPAMGWGQGVQISPPGMAVLSALGLEQEILQAGQIIERADKLSPEGLTIRGRKFGQVSGFAHPHVAISRGTLQKVLAAEAQKRGLEIRLKQAVSGFESVDGGVKVSVEGEDGEDLVRGDLLIGADGIHSAVRAQLFPEESPVFTGYVQYRAVIARQDVNLRLAPGVVTVYGDARRFYSYYLMNESDISFGACVYVGEESEPEESWSSQGEPEELVSQFAGFEGPLSALSVATPYLARMHIFDHQNLPYWSGDGVTLLGDAAHAMLPFAGQATVTAIEDASVLVEELGRQTDLASALKAYESERIPHVGRIRDHCRDRGGIFEEYQVAEKLRDEAWAGQSAVTRQQRLDAIDWSRHDSFLRAMY